MYDSKFDPFAKIDRVRSIWRSVLAIESTPAEAFLLRVKGAEPPWPDDLGYIPFLLHSPTRERHPALIAAIRSPAGNVCGLQHLYLDACGRRASVEPDVLLLGQCAGNAIQLGGASGGRLYVTESLGRGVVLSRALHSPVWVSPFEGGSFHRMELPSQVDRVSIWPDSEAARESAVSAARLWRSGGRDVLVVGEQDR